MERGAVLDRTLRQFALGELDDAARLHVEAALVTDPGVFERLEALENELCEEYLDGALSLGDKERFEAGFLAAPGHRRRLRFVRHLRDAAARRAARSARVLPWRSIGTAFRANTRWIAAAAAAAAVLAVTGAWLVDRDWRLRTRAAESQAARETERRAAARAHVEASAQASDLREQLELERKHSAALAAELAGGSRQASLSSAGRFPAFVLASSLVRSQGTLNRVSVPAAGLVVLLRLPLEDRVHTQYRAVLSDVEGAEVWAASRLRAESIDGRRMVTLAVPSQLLSAGDYRVRLFGVGATGEPQDLASYTLRATTR